MLLRLYLLVYGALIAGAIVTLQRAGVLEHVSRRWVVAVVGVTVGLGILLALLASPSSETNARSGDTGDTKRKR